MGKLNIGQGSTTSTVYVNTITSYGTDLFFGSGSGVLKTNGNVGIGSTNPTQKLDVAGDVNITGNYRVNGNILTTGGGSQWVTTGNNIYYNSGFVGIGTTSPAFGKLYVRNTDGNTSANPIWTGYTSSAFIDGPNYTAGGGANLEVYSNYNQAQDVGGTIGLGGMIHTNGTVAEFGVIKGAKENSVNDNRRGYLSFSTRTDGTTVAEKMRITADGNVGIGTTAPGTLLDVNGAINSRSYINAVGGIYAGGNVGVGTTSPYSQLNVAGSAGTGAPVDGGGTLLLQDTSGGVGNGGALVIGANGNQIYAGIKGYFTNGGNNGQGKLQFYVRPTATDANLTAAMTIDSSGYVGIGSTAPPYKLEVAGDIRANGGWLRTAGATGWYSDSYGGGFYMQDTSWIRTAGSRSIWTDSGLLGSNGGLTVGYGGAGPPAGGAIIGGAVGIGTTNPASTLNVYQPGGGRIAKIWGPSNTVNTLDVGYGDGGLGAVELGYNPAGSYGYLAVLGGPGLALQVMSNGYVIFNFGHNDLAENYMTTGKVVRGSLVAIGTTSPWTVIAADNTHSSLVGVVSTTPGAVMDADGGYMIGGETKPEYNNEKAPIALQGTAPTLVTTQNGPIHMGDAVGISSLPGFGSKMMVSGNIVGKALETFSPNDSICKIVSSLDAITWPDKDGKNDKKPCFKLTDGTYVGKIMVAIAPSWYDPGTLSRTVEKQQKEIDELVKQTKSQQAQNTDLLKRIEELEKK